MARVRAVAWCDDLGTPELGMLLGWNDLTGEERHEMTEWLKANKCGIYLDMILVEDPEMRTAIALRWS